METLMTLTLPLTLKSKKKIVITIHPKKTKSFASLSKVSMATLGVIQLLTNASLQIKVVIPTNLIGCP